MDQRVGHDEGKRTSQGAKFCFRCFSPVVNMDSLKGAIEVRMKQCRSIEEKRDDEYMASKQGYIIVGSAQCSQYFERFDNCWKQMTKKVRTAFFICPKKGAKTNERKVDSVSKTAKYRVPHQKPSTRPVRALTVILSVSVLFVSMSSVCRTPFFTFWPVISLFRPLSVSHLRSAYLYTVSPAMYIYLFSSLFRLPIPLAHANILVTKYFSVFSSSNSLLCSPVLSAEVIRYLSQHLCTYFNVDTSCLSFVRSICPLILPIVSIS